MKLFSIVSAGVLLLLLAGNGYGDEQMPGTMNRSDDTMIAPGEAQPVAPDQDSSLPDLAAPEKSAAGSSPGGVSNDQDQWKSDSDLYSKPSDETPAKPGPDYPGMDRYGPDY